MESGCENKALQRQRSGAERQSHAIGGGAVGRKIWLAESEAGGGISRSVAELKPVSEHSSTLWSR